MKNLVLGGKWKVEGGRNPPASRLPHSTTGSAGLTLIEMIGVMAVMGVLAAIVVPPLIQRLEDTQKIDEEAALDEIARALVKGIQVAGRFPDPNADPLTANGWVAMGAPHSVLGTNAFYYVFPGNQRNFRKFYLDPGAVQNLSMPAAGWSASLFPSATLMYIVSSSKPDLYTSSPNNGSGCQTGGNSYLTNLLRDLKEWRKAYNAAGKVDAPSSVASGWTDRGEYLHVKIIDLKEILTKVTLEDWHTPVSTYGWGTGDSKFGPNDKPLDIPSVSSGYSIFWTPTGDGKSPYYNPSIQSQPDKASLDNFRNMSTAQRYDLLRLELTAVDKGDSTKTSPFPLELRARESAGYSLKSGLNNSVTDFGNPESSAENKTRKETVSFYALRGSSIILYLESDDNTEFQTYILNKENHRFIFKNGSWGAGD
jgi:type II secretory pathway pseudopilin PulG